MLSKNEISLYLAFWACFLIYFSQKKNRFILKLLVHILSNILSNIFRCSFLLVEVLDSGLWDWLSLQHQACESNRCAVLQLSLTLQPLCKACDTPANTRPRTFPTWSGFPQLGGFRLVHGFLNRIILLRDLFVIGKSLQYDWVIPHQPGPESNRDFPQHMFTPCV